jgi:hypothetical protein
VILFDRLAKTRTSLRASSVHNALPRCCSTTFCLQPRLAWFVVHRVFHRQGKSRILETRSRHLDSDVVPTSRQGE